MNFHSGPTPNISIKYLILTVAVIMLGVAIFLLVMFSGLWSAPILFVVACVLVIYFLFRQKDYTEDDLKHEVDPLIVHARDNEDK